MSDIDTFRHEFVGLFLGIPIYHPLEPGQLGWRAIGDRHRLQHQEWGRPNCDPASLVLGGGSGEHPALIFHDVEHAVARYLAWNYDPQALPAEVLNKATSQDDAQTLEYCNWTSLDHRNFYQRCRFEYRIHRRDLRFESWLLLVMGEFALLSLDSLFPVVAGWKAAVAPEWWEPSFSVVTYPCHGMATPWMRGPFEVVAARRETDPPTAGTA
jgi:hypothetical protein